jgi:hypothetical protein
MTRRRRKGFIEQLIELVIELLSGPPARQQVDYATYMRSRAWRQRRAMILDRDGHRCQSCGSTSRLTVHHLTYERLGNENWGDLVTLCQGCHDWVHGKQRRPAKHASKASQEARNSRLERAWGAPAMSPEEQAEEDAWEARAAKTGGDNRTAYRREMRPPKRKKLDTRDLRSRTP